jgi:hypothetical protein
LAKRAAGEALLELLPERPAIERQHLGQHPNRLVLGANRVAGYTRINDLRHTQWNYARVLAFLAQSTGVPQVITSIIGNPNGSGQSMGNTALRRFQRHAAGFNLQCSPQSRSPTRISLPRFIMASLYLLKLQPGEYVAFLGRISPEKRPDRAWMSLPERRPPGFRKCVQVLREPAEWPTKLI